MRLQCVHSVCRMSRACGLPIQVAEALFNFQFVLCYYCLIAVTLLGHRKASGLAKLTVEHPSVQLQAIHEHGSDGDIQSIDENDHTVFDYEQLDQFNEEEALLNLTVGSQAYGLAPSSKMCQAFDTNQLYRLLDDVGSYSSQTMANSIDEVVRFRTLYPADVFIPLQFNDGPANSTEFLPGEQTSYKVPWKPCDRYCKDIRRTLQHGLDKLVLERTYNNENASKNDAALHGCQLEKFFPVGYCVDRGSDHEVKPGLEKLCTACYGVHKLSENCFPQFFSSISCQGEQGCIFDWFARNGHGRCREKHMSFTVLRKVENAACPYWTYDTINIPVSCECYLQRLSWLRA